MTFKVFDIAWYLDPILASIDPVLLPYKNMKAEELSNNQSFYNSIIEPSKYYDRSILIKLAMTLKCEMMIQGLVDELDMSDHNKGLLIEVNKKYGLQECEKGKELLLTWKHPQVINNFTDSFEIRINNVLAANIPEPTMGNDFMRHFVTVNDPVSPPAKKGFTEGFEHFLSSSYDPKAQSIIANSNPIPVEIPTFKLHNIVRNLKNFIKHLTKNLHNLSKSSTYYNNFDNIYGDFTVNDVEVILDEDVDIYTSIGRYFGVDMSFIMVFWNKLYGRVYEKIGKFEKIYLMVMTSIYSLLTNDEMSSYESSFSSWTVPNKYHQQMNSIKNNNKRTRNSFENGFGSGKGLKSSLIIESFLSILVLLYFCLLILISLPPALLDKGKRTLQRAAKVVTIVKQKSLQQMRDVCGVVRHSTSSLASIVRNRSNDSLININVFVE